MVRDLELTESPKCRTLGYSWHWTGHGWRACTLCAAGFAAFAAGIALELGAVGYAFNALASQQGAAGTATNVLDFSPDPYVNASYALSVSDDSKLKLGLFAEDMIGTNPGLVMVGRAEPYVDFSVGALSLRASFPLYLLSYDTTHDPAFKQIGYILDKNYKGINLSTPYGTSTTFLFTNFESISYRISVDKTTALVLAASTEIGLSPALWLYDV